MKVTLYYSKGCVGCDLIKDYLNKHSISFTIIDVCEFPESIESVIQALGLVSLPILEVNNDFIVGFDKRKLDTLLNVK